MTPEQSAEAAAVVRQANELIIELKKARVNLTNRLVKMTQAAVDAEKLVGKWYDGTAAAGDAQRCGEILSFAVSDHGLVYAEPEPEEAIA